MHLAQYLPFFSIYSTSFWCFRLIYQFHCCKIRVLLDCNFLYTRFVINFYSSIDIPLPERYNDNKLNLPDKWITTMATLQHTDELYHILEDEICALKILPGEALSENQLCKRFGVSRTPIRSVLQRLEQNRFVQIIPCKGTIVTAIDIGVVDQLIFQRVAVEGMVFRDFVQSCSPMEILAVEHLYNMLLEAAAGRSDPENFDFNHFLSCDLAMHEYWFRKTSKEYLWEQMTRPQADYSRFIRLDIVGARNVSSVVSEHTEMLRILREKDLDAIEPLMRTHLYGGVSRMGSKIYSDEYRGYFKLPEGK